MKLIESKAELLLQGPGLEGVFKQIEVAGRTCYKSEDKITEDSAKGFVDRMIKSGHGAMLEHGTVYLLFANTRDDNKYFIKYNDNPYSVATYDKLGYVYVTTNYRVLIENNWLDDLKYICEPTKFHLKRYTFRFTTSIGITRELIRHRKFSFANESTRYCNYSRQRLGGELTFIIPQWIYNLQTEEASYPSREWLMEKHGSDLIKHLTCMDRSVAAWWDVLVRAENDYIYLTTTDEGYKLRPEESRGILPLDLKSEIIMTGFAYDWKFFFDLRLFGKTGAPHPDMQELATKAMLAAQDAGIWISIEKQSSVFK